MQMLQPPYHYKRSNKVPIMRFISQVFAREAYHTVLVISEGEIGIGSGRSLFISSLKALLNWHSSGRDYWGTALRGQCGRPRRRSKYHANWDMWPQPLLFHVLSPSSSSSSSHFSCPFVTKWKIILENGLTILLLHCFVFATFVTKMPRNSLGPTIGRYMPFL